ncbi:MAG: tetratricopeptide repeat protein [Spirochaetales bacterium]|nr:tetratricopeptide repeat protein [Spirochaetales bacterium]
MWSEEPQASLADFLSAQGYYDEAVTEYLRFIYLNPQSLQLAEVYKKLALCYSELENWKQAERSLQKAIALTDDREQRYTYKFTFIELLIAKKAYNRAEKELHKIYTMAMEKKYKSRSLFLLSVLYIYTYNWESAETALKEYFGESDTYSESSQKHINDLLAAARKLPYKSKDVAIVLSVLLPGAGQAYSGNVMQGVNALLVNGTAGTLMVYTVLDGYYLDAAMIFLFIFYRFYSGNIYYAEKATLQYNDLLNQNMAQQLLELLLEEGK